MDQFEILEKEIAELREERTQKKKELQKSQERYINHILDPFKTKESFSRLQKLHSIKVGSNETIYDSFELGQFPIVYGGIEKEMFYGYAMGVDWQALGFANDSDSPYFLLALNNMEEFDISISEGMVAHDAPTQPEEFIRGIYKPDPNQSPYWTTTQIYSVSQLASKVSLHEEDDIFKQFSGGIESICAIFDRQESLLQGDIFELKHHISEYSRKINQITERIG